MDAQLLLFPHLGPAGSPEDHFDEDLPDSFFDDDKREEPELEERIDPQTGLVEECPYGPRF